MIVQLISETRKHQIQILTKIKEQLGTSRRLLKTLFEVVNWRGQQPYIRQGDATRFEEIFWRLENEKEAGHCTSLLYMTWVVFYETDKFLAARGKLTESQKPAPARIVKRKSANRQSRWYSALRRVEHEEFGLLHDEQVSRSYLSDWDPKHRTVLTCWWYCSE